MDSFETQMSALEELKSSPCFRFMRFEQTLTLDPELRHSSVVRKVDDDVWAAWIPGASGKLKNFVDDLRTVGATKIVDAKTIMVHESLFAHVVYFCSPDNEREVVKRYLPRVAVLEKKRKSAPKIPEPVRIL